MFVETFEMEIVQKKGASYTRLPQTNILEDRTKIGRVYSMHFSALGVMCANGTGVVKDPVEAVRWFRRSADLGEASA